MKVEINIPSNLNEIPLKNYQIFIEETKELLKSSKDVRYNENCKCRKKQR